MDYRIFNVRTWSFLCARIHTWIRDTDSESAQHLWFGKTLTIFSCAPDSDGVRTSGLWISSPTLYQWSYPVNCDFTKVWMKQTKRTHEMLPATWESKVNTERGCILLYQAWVHDSNSLALDTYVYLPSCTNDVLLVKCIMTVVPFVKRSLSLLLLLTSRATCCAHAGMERAIEVMLVEVLTNLFRDNPPRPQPQPRDNPAPQDADDNSQGRSNAGSSSGDNSSVAANDDLQRDGAPADEVPGENKSLVQWNPPVTQTIPTPFCGDRCWFF